MFEEWTEFSKRFLKEHSKPEKLKLIVKIANVFHKSDNADVAVPMKVMIIFSMIDTMYIGRTLALYELLVRLLVFPSDVW